MSWRLAKSLITLRQQIDQRHPKRSKKSDGAVGDLAHRKRKSDHNPNSHGVVTAIDITHDPANGFNSHTFADHLRKMKDRRIKYVISNHKIFSSTTVPWTWRKYTGSNPHVHHVHISVSAMPTMYDSTAMWSVAPVVVPRAGIISAAQPDPEPEEFVTWEELPDGDPENRCHWADVADKGVEEDHGEDIEEAPQEEARDTSPGLEHD